MPRDTEHPIWSIVRLIVVFAGITIFLYLNSNAFDETEVKTIVELMLLAGGFEVVKRKLANGKDKS
jgi:nitric oxide reductase large subunit